jgi:hypothetical protein
MTTESSFTRITPESAVPMKPFWALKEKRMALSNQLLDGSLILTPPGNLRPIKSSGVGADWSVGKESAGTSGIRARACFMKK